LRLLSLPVLFGLGELAPAERRTLALVYASSVALIMGVNFIQPALPAMSQPFGVGDAALGLVMTVYTLPAIFLSPLFGMIADLYGRRPLLGWGLIGYGLAGAAIALAPTFAWVLALRALQGVAFSAVIPLTIVLIGDLLEGRREIGGQGLKVFLDRVGYLVLPPLGGLLAAIAWFWPFAFYLAAAPLGVLAFFWLPPDGGRLRAENSGYVRSVLSLTRHPRLLLAFSAGFLRFFLDYGFLTYFPLFVVRAHGLSTAAAGALYFFFSIGAMITSSQAARLAGRAGVAHLLFAAFVASGLALVAVPFLPGFGPLGAALFLYGLANGVISPMQKSLLTQNAPRELRGGIVSFDRLLQQVSKTVATSAVGILLVAVELSTIFWLLGLLSLASVALVALLLPAQKSAAA
jgi:ACDE family multidrug resistance protein